MQIAPGTEVSHALPSAPTEPQPGDRVELHLIRGERVSGIVMFVEGVWVYWRDDDGRTHASRPDALRVLVSRPPPDARAAIDRLRHG